MTYEEYSKDKNKNHHEWFCSIGDTASITPPDCLVQKSRRIGTKGVPLSIWDSYDTMFRSSIRAAKVALGYPRNGACLSDTVCTLKALVRRQLESEKNDS